MSTCAGTHIDALAHVVLRRAALQRLPDRRRSRPSTAPPSSGAEKLPPIVTRGVLLDVARLKGVDGLDEIDPGYAITADDLDAAAEPAGSPSSPATCCSSAPARCATTRPATASATRCGVELQPARPVGAHRRSGSTTTTSPGCSYDTYAYEAFPPSQPDWSDCLAVHLLQLRDMGLLQGQNWDLEDAGRRPAPRRAGATCCWSPPPSRSWGPPRPRSRPSPCSEPARGVPGTIYRSSRGLPTGEDPAPTASAGSWPAFAVLGTVGLLAFLSSATPDPDRPAPGRLARPRDRPRPRPRRRHRGARHRPRRGARTRRGHRGRVVRRRDLLRVRGARERSPRRPSQAEVPPTTATPTAGGGRAGRHGRLRRHGGRGPGPAQRDRDRRRR